MLLFDCGDHNIPILSVQTSRNVGTARRTVPTRTSDLKVELKASIDRFPYKWPLDAIGALIQFNFVVAVLVERRRRWSGRRGR